MYLAHFALTRYPFDTTLESSELFPSAAITEAQVRLKHLLELRGIGFITGEAGSGKTTVCRQLTSSLHPGLYRVFYVPLSTGNVMDMYKSIAWELGLPTERNRAAAFRVIRAEITRLTLEAKQRPLLIVDEAHHLRNEVLEDLRLLTNYAMDAENRLCLLLVGLTELRRRLAMSVHEALAQRIVIRHHTSGLTPEELPQYLTHRLRLAGCELPLFAPAAIEALFQATHGRPRKVNRLGNSCTLGRRPRRNPASHPRAPRSGARGSQCLRAAPMHREPHPIVALPNALSDEAAAALLELLHEMARVLESHYATQLQRYYHRAEDRPQAVCPEHDPPF